MSLYSRISNLYCIEISNEADDIAKLDVHQLKAMWQRTKRSFNTAPTSDLFDQKPLAESFTVAQVC
jgi:hypothetical protein